MLGRWLLRCYVAFAALVVIGGLGYIYLAPPASLHATRDGVPYLSPPVINPATNEAVPLEELVRHYKGER